VSAEFRHQFDQHTACKIRYERTAEDMVTQALDPPQKHGTDQKRSLSAGR
jgi:hypothetical protein